jgi:hypothetical protein
MPYDAGLPRNQPISYYRPGEDEPFFIDDSGGFELPTIGDGWLWEDGTRWRVADRWLSLNKHGYFDVGWHVFLEPVEVGGADDRLKHLAPDYFAS